MKTCEYCGSHVDNDAIYCPHCGASKFKVEEKHSRLNSYTYSSGNAQNTYNNASGKGKGESKTLGILSIVFALLLPIVGLAFGCIGLKQYEEGGSSHKLAKAGLIISIVVIVLNALTNSSILF